MSDKQRVKPFISSGHRHDLVSQLARTRVRSFDEAVNESIRQGLESKETKTDGKNGAIDGLGSIIRADSLVAEDPWGAPPWQPPKFPKGKESKEGKESKDGKESKEGKESKDSKEGKDSSDSGKTGGDEASNPVYIYGDPDTLNWSVMTQVAQSEPTVVRQFVKGVSVI